MRQICIANLEETRECWLENSNLSIVDFYLVTCQSWVPKLVYYHCQQILNQISWEVDKFRPIISLSFPEKVPNARSITLALISIFFLQSSIIYLWTSRINKNCFLRICNFNFFQIFESKKNTWKFEEELFIKKGFPSVDCNTSFYPENQAFMVSFTINVKIHFYIIFSLNSKMSGETPVGTNYTDKGPKPERGR